MLTAGITAAVAGILGVFGIKPGAYLVAVAAVVKVTLVGASVFFGARLMRKRQATSAATVTTETPPLASPPAQDEPRP